jgi:hypothetical protein
VLISPLRLVSAAGSLNESSSALVKAPCCPLSRSSEVSLPLGRGQHGHVRRRQAGAQRVPSTPIAAPGHRRGAGMAGGGGRAVAGPHAALLPWSACATTADDTALPTRILCDSRRKPEQCIDGGVKPRRIEFSNVAIEHQVALSSGHRQEVEPWSRQ